MTSTMMRAVLQDSVGDASTLYVGETETPIPGPGEVLIRVSCTALNRMDLLQCKGLYPVPQGASKIIGVEVSGYIEALGDECSGRFNIGDRCMALLQGGGYAEYATAFECCVLHAPSSLCMKTLASIPENWMTAYQLLHFVGGVKSGETVLLHASASGVGQAAIQLACQAGAKCIATCRTDDKVAVCLEKGCIAAFNINERANEFSSLIKAVNEGKGVDIVLDPVGSSYAKETFECMETDARWVLYGLMGGKAIDDPTFLGKILAKRISLIGTTLRSRDKLYKQDLTNAIEKDVLPLFSSGKYTAMVDSTFEMTTEGVQAAHVHMSRNQNIGKIVLQVEEANKKPKNSE